MNVYSTTYITEGSSFVLLLCIFNGFRDANGGGLYLNNELSNLSVSECFFDGCYSKGNGGGIFSTSGSFSCYKSCFYQCGSYYGSSSFVLSPIIHIGFSSAIKNYVSGVNMFSNTFYLSGLSNQCKNINNSYNSLAWSSGFGIGKWNNLILSFYLSTNNDGKSALHFFYSKNENFIRYGAILNNSVSVGSITSDAACFSVYNFVFHRNPTILGCIEVGVIDLYYCSVDIGFNQSWPIGSTNGSVFGLNNPSIEAIECLSTWKCYGNALRPTSYIRRQKNSFVILNTYLFISL